MDLHNNVGPEAAHRLTHDYFISHYREHAHDRPWWEARLRTAGATQDDIAFWFAQVSDALNPDSLPPRTAPDHVRLLHWAVNSHHAGLPLTDAWDWYTPFLLASPAEVVEYLAHGRTVKNYTDVLHAQLQSPHLHGDEYRLKRTQADVDAWMRSTIPIERIVSVYIPAGVATDEAVSVFEAAIASGEPLATVLNFLAAMHRRS